MLRCKRIAFAFVLAVAALVCAPRARAQNAETAIRGWCQDGAQPVVTSGLTSTTEVQASYPGCTITVTVHGGGAATIYSDRNFPPTALANPFTSQTNGQWLFYAQAGCYDVTTQNAGFPQPVTYFDICVGLGGGGSGGILVNGVAVPPTANFINSGSVTFNVTGSNISLTATGGGSGCTLPGVNTGLLSEHPAGTCYDSLDATWDDGSGKQNLQFGDGTNSITTSELSFLNGRADSVTNGYETFIRGDSNIVTGDTFGIGVFQQFWLDGFRLKVSATGIGAGGSLANITAIGVGNDNAIGPLALTFSQTDTATMSNVMCLLSCKGEGPSGVGPFTAINAGNMDTSIFAGAAWSAQSTGTNSNTSSIYALGEGGGGAAGNFLSAAGSNTQDIIAAGFDIHATSTGASTDLSGALQLGPGPLTLTASGGSTYTNAVQIGDALTGSSTTGTNAETFEIGHSLSITNSSHAYLFGENGVFSGVSNEIGIGLSSTPELEITAGHVTLPSLASAGTECVQASATGQLSVTGSACGSGGGGGTPGGATNDVQLNVSGAFAADTGEFTEVPATHTFQVGLSAGSHWTLTPTALTCFQSNGTSPCVPSLQGSEGTSPTAGSGLLGWNIGSDHLGHFGDGGEDYGPSTIVNRNWVSSVANTYASDSLIPALQKYDIFCGDPQITNTGASTFNVNSLGALSITKFNGTALAAGDLVAGIPACVQYTGAAFSLLNPQTTSGGGGGGAATLTALVPNDPSTGTTLNKLAYVLSSGTLSIANTSVSAGIVGIVTAGAGTTGSATVTYQGANVSCVFDGTATAGDIVEPSALAGAPVSGDCHDSGLTLNTISTTTTGQFLGLVHTGGSGAGTYTVDLFPVNTQSKLPAPTTTNGPFLMAGVASSVGNIYPTDNFSFIKNNGFWQYIITTSPTTNPGAFGSLLTLEPSTASGGVPAGLFVETPATLTANTCMLCIGPSGAGPTSVNNNALFIDQSGVVRFGRVNVNNEWPTIAVNYPNFGSINNYSLAKLSGTNSPNFPTTMTTSDSFGSMGSWYIGSAVIALAPEGRTFTLPDSNTTSGDYLVPSTSTGGDVHDAGASWPFVGQVIGRELATNSSGAGAATESYQFQTEVRGGAYGLYSKDMSAQTAAIASTTMFTVGAANAEFRVSATINCTTTSASATATFTLSYTDTGSTVQTQSITDTCTALVTTGIPQLTVAIRAKTGTAISWSTSIANTPTYDVAVRLEQL